MTEKRGMKALEAWCRKVTNGYRDVKINNMTTAWRDGLAFCAIIHHFQPDLIDFDSLSKDNIFQNNDLAFSMAERLGIPALLDAEDMVSYKVPDKLSILTYVSQLYQHFHSLEPPPPAKRPLEAANDGTADAAESPEKRSAIDVPSASIPAASKLPSLPRTDVCQACKNRVYILERLIVDNKLYHRTCFKCLKCRAVLSPGSYVECDRSDQYECIQCPLPEDKLAKKRLGEALLKRFSDAPNGRPAWPQPQPQRTIGLPLFEDTPKPSIIAEAAAKARSQFHDQNLNNVESENSPFLDTGQTPTDSPPKPGDDSNESSLDAASSGSKPDNRDDPDTENAPETITSSDHPSALPSVDDLSSDVRNNNVKIPPSFEPPPPPGGEGEAKDGLSKPALPQKPVVLERPRFLPIQRPNHVKTKASEPKIVNLDSHARTSAELRPSEPVSENTPPAAEPKVSRSPGVADPDEAFRTEPKVSPCSGNVDVTTADPDEASGTGEVSGAEAGVCSSEKPDAENANVESTSQKADSNVPDPVGADRSVPVAAPRAIRAKRQHTQVPQKRESRHAVPVPPKRSTVPQPRDIDGGEDFSTPPKPPRQVPAAEEGGEAAPGATKEGGSRGSEYPLELNPFGEDEETAMEAREEEPKKKVTLNPFGDSEDEEEIEEKTAEREVPKAPEPPQRRLVPCYVNPFSSDSDEDSEESSRFSTPSSRPATTSPHPASAASTMRKKRPAPKPPGTGSAASTPGVTPQTAQKTSAPPPRRIHLGGEGGEGFLTEKSLKELDNMNRTKAVQEPAPGSDLLSPDSLDSRSGRSTPSSQPPGATRPANTFGNWKKKKRAPPLPVPRRRQIATIPMKDIQAELLEIEEKHLELETQGVQIEKSIREKFNDEIDPSVEEEDLILQLFDLVNKKNDLFRRQTELTYLKRQQRLEEEHADLEFQIRLLMEKSDDKKTDEDRALEDQLIARLVEVVTQRSEIIESMEMDRVREAEEDQSIHQQHLGLQFCNSNRGSMSSQGSLAGLGNGGTSGAPPSGKDKSAKKKKDKEKKKKSKDEDKDTDETESRKKTPKDKKKKWF